MIAFIIGPKSASSKRKPIRSFLPPNIANRPFRKPLGETLRQERRLIELVSKETKKITNAKSKETWKLRRMTYNDIATKCALEAMGITSGSASEKIKSLMQTCTSKYLDYHMGGGVHPSEITRPALDCVAAVEKVRPGSGKEFLSLQTDYFNAIADIDEKIVKRSGKQ